MGVYIKNTTYEIIEDLFVKHHIIMCEGDFVEVPEPHGRLIDADALKEYGIMAEDYCTDLFVHVDDIDDAPTVIEAEEQDHECG